MIALELVTAVVVVVLLGFAVDIIAVTVGLMVEVVEVVSVENVIS